ncbi:hypothetical protein [Arenimonas oryziterrae]|uniref:Uncharacterized protein n=1 Tax=Arenimonas oryziterrae DSM 21050 = YC6267 TaxID=1121015 RepID=A0A091ASJ3_9GAMM|nr:hypothetical protein [Arenimonas oryziterrae]KFN42336.1 hypothetical protein N789_14195 [Arenimonas oryziterrae DSM 21050 = YC6267]
MNPISVYVTLGLALALLLSIAGNTWQLWHSGVAAGRAEGEATITQLRDTNAGLAKTAAVNSAIAVVAKEQNLALVNDLAAIAERARGERIVYRTAAAAAPLAPNCAPGQARMDAVNAMLGPQAEVKP